MKITMILSERPRDCQRQGAGPLAIGGALPQTASHA